MRIEEAFTTELELLTFEKGWSKAGLFAINEREAELFREKILEDIFKISKDIENEDFWKDFCILPASSTGKYHSKQDNAEGGLIIHTKKVFYVYLALIRSRTDCGDWKLRFAGAFAALFHDIGKYINPPTDAKTGKKHTNSVHPLLGAQWLKYEATKLGLAERDFWYDVADLIEVHHGKYNEYNYKNCFGVKDNKVSWRLPHNELGWLLHFADVVASMPNMEIV